MSGLILSSRVICFNCLRRTVRDEFTSSFFPPYGQLRGKKKIAKKITTIKVKLLQDVPGYGRKGSITPVAPGRMRNEWYPRQKAEYVTMASLQGVKPQAVVAERDFKFKTNIKDDVVEESEPKFAPEKVEPKLISAQRATKLIEALIPKQILFYRIPIQEPDPEPQPEELPNRSRRANYSATADLDAASESLARPAKKQMVTIFGAVSTVDVADSIKALLAKSEEATRIALGPEDLKFVQEQSSDSDDQVDGIEGERLKALGDFEVVIKVKGGSPVTRTVSVRPQETSPVRKHFVDH